MRPRQEIIELFSTFAQFESDHFRQWLSDSKLRRNIERCLADLAEPLSENFWALYWHRSWQHQPTPLARLHLSAYLQEPCYWAAQKTLTRFTNVQYRLADYFQMAIATIEPILEGFQPERSSSLKTYASMMFLSRVKDLLRRSKEADICTRWSLLRKISKKTVLEVLHHVGLLAPQIEQYRLAWMCFNAVYVQTQPRGTQKLADPDRALWRDIADLYNAQRSQLTLPGSPCDAATIEQWLTSLSTRVRQYLYPTLASLNALNPDGETMPELPDHSSDSLMAQLIAQEEHQTRSNQQAQMQTVLLTALQQLDASTQELVKLYYQQGLSQQQIMQMLKMSQPSVSRRLAKSREALLSALVQWSQDSLNISVTSNLVKEMSAALEEWLQIRYGELISK